MIDINLSPHLILQTLFGLTDRILAIEPFLTLIIITITFHHESPCILIDLYIILLLSLIKHLSRSCVSRVIVIVTAVIVIINPLHKFLTGHRGRVIIMIVVSIVLQIIYVWIVICIHVHPGLLYTSAVVIIVL